MDPSNSDPNHQSVDPGSVHVEPGPGQAAPGQRICPSCQRPVPVDAPECPHCGQRLQVWEDLPRPFPRPSRFRAVNARQSSGRLITPYLIGANLFMFILEILLSGGTNITNHAALRLGVSLPLGAIISTGQYWRWVTACFLHGGLMHIGFNMVALYSLGPVTEQLYGRSKFVSIYLLSGIAGYLLSSAAGETSLGASGAIFGLLGMLFVFGRRQHLLGAGGIRQQALFWLVLNLVFGFAFPGIDWHAHVGGAIGGIVLSWLAGTGQSQTAREERLWRGVELACVGLTAFCVVLMLVTGGRILG